MVADARSSETPVTAVGAFTVTAQLAVKEPSRVVAVMTELPAETAVTMPVAATVAWPLELDQETALFDAFAGETVATRRVVSPSPISIAERSRETPVAGTSVWYNGSWQDVDTNKNNEMTRATGSVLGAVFNSLVDVLIPFTCDLLGSAEVAFRSLFLISKSHAKK